MVSFCETTEAVEFDTQDAVTELNVEENTQVLVLKPEATHVPTLDANNPSAEQPKRRRLNSSTLLLQPAPFPPSEVVEVVTFRSFVDKKLDLFMPPRFNVGSNEQQQQHQAPRALTFGDFL